MRVGIDLDNTIIHYDDAFLIAARERGLIPPSFTGTKQQLRDHLRTLKDGEIEWQKLQGHVYGKGISHAKLFPGVKEFLSRAKGHELFIISHKTEFGHYDESRTNLREAALGFLDAQGVLAHIPRAQVHFAPTRSEKVNIIASLAPECFIDDLIEVYEEPHFPKGVRRILFHFAPTPPPAGNWQVCKSWQEITETIFA